MKLMKKLRTSKSKTDKKQSKFKVGVITVLTVAGLASYGVSSMSSPHTPADAAADEAPKAEKFTDARSSCKISYELPESISYAGMVRSAVAAEEECTETAVPELPPFLDVPAVPAAPVVAPEPEQVVVTHVPAPSTDLAPAYDPNNDSNSVDVDKPVVPPVVEPVVPPVVVPVPVVPPVAPVVPPQDDDKWEPVTPPVVVEPVVPPVVVEPVTPPVVPAPVVVVDPLTDEGTKYVRSLPGTYWNQFTDAQAGLVTDYLRALCAATDVLTVPLPSIDGVVGPDAANVHLAMQISKLTCNSALVLPNYQTVIEHMPPLQPNPPVTILPVPNHEDTWGK